MPPGAAVLMALLYLSLLPTPMATASDGLAAHLQVEALKQAFAMRMSLGDPSFVRRRRPTPSRLPARTSPPLHLLSLRLGRCPTCSRC
eukprot:scaffold1327_cov60-Phaeocystis_antarctica.AAC.5